MRGDRLREMRLKLGYSQETLAEMINIGNRQIWRYENGETEPDGITVARIARSLSVSTDYLLGLTDDPLPYVMKESDLTHRERQALAAWRSGDVVSAIKVILSD